MLQMMAQNCFAHTNYGVPQIFEDCGTLWSNQLDNCELKDGMEMPPSSSFGGIMSSLVKKGLATCSGFGDDEDTCALTEEGFKAWQEQVQNVDFSNEESKDIIADGEGKNVHKLEAEQKAKESKAIGQSDINMLWDFWKHLVQKTTFDGTLRQWLLMMNVCHPAMNIEPNLEALIEYISKRVEDTREEA